MSMPSTGFYLFLRQYGSTETVDDVVCQCPQRASTYFFDWLVTAAKILLGIVSMPSTGFYLFLQKEVYMMKRFLKGVNALNGLLLISSVMLGIIAVVGVVCQCPQRASTYFFCRKKNEE